MDPQEKMLLKRTLELSEENNKILRKMQRVARWATLWGFIKVAIVIVPLILGFIYLQPFFDQIAENYSGIRELLNLQPR
ncbi:MAG: hypothetical protein UT07_C0018G0001 [Parcubacteria group bacterium GW2011_GWB1_38_8]|uniref:Uncharacterized protein n=1 Tax=Candidatus Zambryskibacteria bacterium RIFCSPLOWO2_02_FULL_39_14 TaxID=1802769 RepID=A0A1G2UHN3_9BACT|nr:MAG: hypothetical protein UT07_C0018G0001 [Parcubacteria group bacterium GW2011_GWB1_38_8]KKR30171.1 MAG: hypothetical protein UT62_C0019G0003 [Parcubacteria group bacterium GW2011_GWC1_39_8]OHA95754.1 MAG: hypothetical protein A3C62_01775 [Candidatus Zambryskibacteria bacterium RIFCSPHIGHO2_02_FULL_39_16]OHB08936.1 MAG: hypothetical protein A3I86_02100 [Candidatus Zambryskibacteria bacterium RIFCSPLOWO2_02_FULL_39_14]